MKTSSPEEIIHFFGMLSNMINEETVTIKALVTAWVGSSKLLSTIAREAGVLAPDHPIIDVPPSSSRRDAKVWVKSLGQPYRLHSFTSSKRAKAREAAADSVRFSSDESSDSDRYHDAAGPEKQNVDSSGKQADRRFHEPDPEDTESAIDAHDVLRSSSDETEREGDKRKTPKVVQRPTFSPTSSHKSKVRRQGVSSDESSDDDLAVPSFTKVPLVRGLTWDTEPAESDVDTYQVKLISNLPAVLLKPVPLRSPLSQSMTAQTSLGSTVSVTQQDREEAAKSSSGELRNGSKKATGVTLSTEDDSSDG